jgi:hypothetical protein
MTALEQRRGDEYEPTTLALPVQTLLEQGVLTPTAFHVDRVVELTERSNEDDLTAVPEFLRWAAIGGWLGGLNTAVKWWIGDWLAFGEGAWGERYAQAAEATGLDLGTLQNYAYVCRQVLPRRRRPELSFTSHLKVAKLEPPEQKAWLAHAIKHDLRSKELESAIRETGGQPPSSGDGVPEPELETRPRVANIDPDTVMAAARKVWRDAISDGNGSYLIPAGTFRLLASSLGKATDG